MFTEAGLCHNNYVFDRVVSIILLDVTALIVVVLLEIFEDRIIYYKPIVFSKTQIGLGPKIGL